MSPTVFVVDVPWGEVAARARLCRDLDFDRRLSDRSWSRFSARRSAPICSSGRRRRKSRRRRRTRRPKPLVEARRSRRRGQLARIRLDTLVGMGLSNLVALSIMFDDGGDAARARHRRHPNVVAGGRGAAADRRRIRLSSSLRLGIVGTGLLAVPVLAGIGRLCGWRSAGLDGRAGAEAAAREGVLRRPSRWRR